MCTTVDTEEIIILSDDEDCEDSSVLIVEDVETVKKNVSAAPPSAVDEDLVITFSRRAEVLPHARYDCPIHAFTATDCEISAPVASNNLMCDQCFCYICDKLASACETWIQVGVCHCNSHKKSLFWYNLRNSSLLGGLKTFNLTLCEIDSHLRRAETLLVSFRQGLSELFSSFLKAAENKKYVYDYTPVYDFVWEFLNIADKQDSRAAAIMRLGAAEDFIRHFQVSGTTISPSPFANAAEAKLLLLQRVVNSVQRQMVMEDFAPEFAQKLQDFHKRFFYPPELKSMKNSLCVRPWDDVLLVTVLKGQNVTGVRKDKGKKDQLTEQISVVLLRTELLQRQHRYRELCRYLRVVTTDDTKRQHHLQDLIPFFMCLEGSLMGALHSLIPLVNAPALRFTPQLFIFYLHIFKTAKAPRLLVDHPSQLCGSDAAWEPIKDAEPVPNAALVRFALRVQKCSSAVFSDSQCWSSLMTIVNTQVALPEPNPQFLHEARDVVNSILFDKHGSNIHIPRFFQEVYPAQSLLLLVTGALVVRILCTPLSPALPVLDTYKKNMWAFKWLWEGLSANPDRLRCFLQEMSHEVKDATGTPLAARLTSFR